MINKVGVMKPKHYVAFSFLQQDKNIIERKLPRFRITWHCRVFETNILCTLGIQTFSSSVSISLDFAVIVQRVLAAVNQLIGLLTHSVAVRSCQRRFCESV